MFEHPSRPPCCRSTVLGLVSSKRAAGIVLAAGLAAFWTASCDRQSPVAGPRPGDVRPVSTVLLITVDTLRADRLGFHGYPRATSPNLDVLAREAVVFDRAVAQFPKTGPSFGSLFTSRYAQSTGMTHRAAVRLPETYRTLPEVLQQSGFRTTAVISNPVMPKRLGWAQGFDEYVEIWASDPTALDAPYALRRVTEAAQVNRAALPALQAAADRRRAKSGREFLWIHYTDPHAPYQLPPGRENSFLGDAWFTGDRLAEPETWAARDLDGRRDLKYYLAQYDANVRYVDEKIGELLAEARRLKLLDDALVVFAADHGESLGEHGAFFDHGGEPYATTSHVPLLLWAPGRLPARRIAEPVELVDLFPTLTRWLGLDVPSDLEGDDLGALLRGQGAAAGDVPRYAFSEAGSGGGAKRTHFWSVEDRGSKLIFQLIRKGAAAPGASASGRWQYFDLAQDPGEQHNLVETRPTELRRLRTALEAWMRQSADSATSEEQSDETVRALKALGYLQ